MLLVLQTSTDVLWGGFHKFALLWQYWLNNTPPSCTWLLRGWKIEVPRSASQERKVTSATFKSMVVIGEMHQCGWSLEIEITCDGTTLHCSIVYCFDTFMDIINSKHLLLCSSLDFYFSCSMIGCGQLSVGTQDRACIPAQCIQTADLAADQIMSDTS